MSEEINESNAKRESLPGAEIDCLDFLMDTEKTNLSGPQYEDFHANYSQPFLDRYQRLPDDLKQSTMEWINFFAKRGDSFAQYIVEKA